MLMKPNEISDGGKNYQQSYQLIMSSHLPIKAEDSPVATEALEYLLQNDDPNSLMCDLNELLRRDPTLSSLAPVKDEPDEGSGKVITELSIFGSDNIGSGMPIPSVAKRFEPVLQQQQLQQHDASSSSFGAPFFAASSSSESPLLSSPPHFQQQQHLQQQMFRQQQQQPQQAMDTTPARLNSELDVDLSDYFTSDAAKNVSLCPSFKRTSTEQSQQPQQQRQQQQTQVKSEQFLQGEDSLIFSSTSFGGQSGGVAFATGGTQAAAAAAAAALAAAAGSSSASQKDLLSSSVPASIFHNSPLSDILPDLSPASGSHNSPSVSPNLSAAAPHPSSHAGPERHSTLHKLLLRKDPVMRPSPVRSPESRKTLEKMKSSLSASNPLLCQQLSKSAPAQPNTNYLDGVLWARREPRQHISSVCSVGNESSVADEVNEVLNGISPNELPDIESDDDEEQKAASAAADHLAGVAVKDEDSSDNSDESDDDDVDSADAPMTPQQRRRANTTGAIGSKSLGKRDRHFWQYNVQAKGPKGQKIVVSTKIEDPHKLNDIVDPVFSGDVQLQGIKHSGKARRGDGNDLTPNAKKLAAIGQELEQLSKVINDLTPVSEMPFSTRCKSRKEKNKLASRACRLKKKAQHEANKLKCHGLEEEHHKLSGAIAKAREILRVKVNPSVTVSQADLTAELDNTVKLAMRDQVAGQTTEFVNKKIEIFLKSV